MKPVDLILDAVKWRELPQPHVSMRGDPDALYATHVGVADFGGFELQCYVLNDGQRVFDADDLKAMFDQAASTQQNEQREDR